MPREHIDTTYIKIAKVLSERSTCVRRKVGCVLVDKNGKVLATGYNGVPYGVEHCIDKPCPGANAASGDKLDMCRAIHAEQNALLQCKDVSEIEVCYTTTFPCMHCYKLLLNTGVNKVVYLNPYGDDFQYIDDKILFKKINESELIYD